MIPVLVTGGAGYIGSHTAKALSRAGFEPIVLDNLSTGHRWTVKWGSLIQGDVGDESLVRDIVRRHAVKAVLHFAASAYVGESMSSPRSYFSNNVRNTLSLLDALLDSEVKQIVFSSTCATYGIPEALPIDETQAQRPVNPYGESKLFVERALYWYGKAYGLGSVVLRYFNAAGADPDGEIGELHDPETHLIPRVVQAALGQLPEVDVYGDDYSTFDGTAIRDYIHVTDLADAHVLALRHLLRRGESVALNLGTGRGHSVREVIDAVERASKRKVNTRLRPRREGDPSVLVARCTKAKELLDWTPHLSDLETIVRTSLFWQQSQRPVLMELADTCEPTRRDSVPDSACLEPRLDCRES